jgi:hypothetical protein
LTPTFSAVTIPMSRWRTHGTSPCRFRNPQPSPFPISISQSPNANHSPKPEFGTQPVIMDTKTTSLFNIFPKTGHTLSCAATIESFLPHDLASRQLGIGTEAERPTVVTLHAHATYGAPAGEGVRGRGCGRWKDYPYSSVLLRSPP